MVKNGIKYGISYLPKNCIAYRDGYRYGAYREECGKPETGHITAWFKTRNEIQTFVNKNPEYGREATA